MNIDIKRIQINDSEYEMFDIRTKKKATALPAAVGRQEADLELGLALSVSHDLERRRSSLIVSTQEYQEDERRREELLNNTGEDMFADTVVEESSEEEVEEEVEEEERRVERRWVGDAEVDMSENTNEHVGTRPKPTIVLNLQNQTVNDSQMMVSFQRPKVGNVQPRIGNAR